MTDAELEAIAKRWSGGAQVNVTPEADGRMSVAVPYAGDVPALVAEVRNARRALEILRAWWVDHYGDLSKHVQPDEPSYAEDVFRLGLGEALPPEGS